MNKAGEKHITSSQRTDMSGQSGTSAAGGRSGGGAPPAPGRIKNVISEDAAPATPTAAASSSRSSSSSTPTPAALAAAAIVMSSRRTDRSPTLLDLMNAHPSAQSVLTGAAVPAASASASASAGPVLNHPPSLLMSNPPRPAPPPAVAIAAASAASHPMQDIVTPGPNDVLMGRGGGINNKIGNIKFRELVRQQKLRYLAAKKVDKPKVAVDVVRMWRSLSPPGRFIEPTPGTKYFHDVGDRKAQLKASQCLRERTPEVKLLVADMKAKKKSMRNPDILVPVVPVGASMPESNDIVKWATQDPTPTSRNVQFRSLITSKAYRIVPLYYLRNFQRRCIQRQVAAAATSSGWPVSAGSSTGAVEHLALLVEMKASYAEEIKEEDVAKKRGIEERGTQLVAARTENRYGWVRGIPNGRIELSNLTDTEKAMVTNIMHQIISGDPSALLPKSVT